jgi:hypothetical protein
VLQISTGKFFATNDVYVTRHRGVLYTNYRLQDDVETVAGALRPLKGGGDVRGVLYEGDERLEAMAPDGRREFLVSVGGDHLLQDFAAVASFGLDVTCTPDADLVRRLTRAERLPLGVPQRPSEYVPRVFDPVVQPVPADASRLQSFVEALVALERAGYEAAMRAIRRYVTGLHRIGDDLDLAYTLLVASIESLAQQFDDFRPTWNDYAQAKRERVDAALRRTDASKETADAIRTALLDLEHAAVARRYREFTLRHLTPAFFRDEAIGVTRPVRQRDLTGTLEEAYRLRSSYVHTLRELPRILKLTPSHGDTVYGDGKLVLTFQGMARVARHVILTFVERGRKVEHETFAYRRTLPNIVSMSLADSFWLHIASGYNHRTARRYLSGFLRELEAAMVAPVANRPPVTAIPDVLAKIEQLVPGLAKPVQKIPMLTLYLMFHRLVAPAAHRPNPERFFDRYARLFEEPSVESLVARVILGDEDPPWTAEQIGELLEGYFAQRGRRDALAIPPVFEAAVTLVAADTFRRAGDTERARALISTAVANLPGHKALMELEQEAIRSEVPVIDWRKLLLPVSDTDSNASVPSLSDYDKAPLPSDVAEVSPDERSEATTVKNLDARRSSGDSRAEATGA